MLGGAVTVAAFAAHLVATTLPVFIVVRAVYGVGEALFFVAALAAVSDLAPEERRGEAINIASLSVYLGLAIGPFLGETILAATGFAVVWIVAAADHGCRDGAGAVRPRDGAGACLRRPRRASDRRGVASSTRPASCPASSS